MAVLRTLIQAVVVGLLSCSVLGAATITVDLNGGADYTEIQPAIDAAANGDTVLVKPGEYVITEPINFLGKAITVRSEGGPEETTIRMSNAPTDPGKRSVVIFENGEGSASVLEGFTLTGGQGVTIAGNSATGGGGVYCASGSSPTLTNCTISQNAAIDPSGCSEPVIPGDPFPPNCTISLRGCGGGLYCAEGSSPSLTNCTISGNRASASGSGRGQLSACGGGVYCAEGSSASLTNCTISGNRAELNPLRFLGQLSAYGGGVYCSSPATLINCRISGNLASASGKAGWCQVSAEGGGVYCNSSATLINSTISNNSVRSSLFVSPGQLQQEGASGGGLYCYESSPTLTNCTISGNSVSAWMGGPGAGPGGGVYCSSASPALVNCIVWGNTPESVCGNLSHCLTDQDPLFVDPTNGDYRLRPGSPAIDAGTSEGAPATDIEGHDRLCGKGVDIGAYEFGNCPTPTERFKRGDVDGNGTLNITDPIKLLGHLFRGEAAPLCLDTADVDDSGVLDLTDAVYSLLFQFASGPEPASPFPDCGIDPVIDALDCQSYPGCE